MAVAAGTQNRRLVLTRDVLDALIVAGLIALFLTTFVVRTFYIPSGSMEPTLRMNDVLLVDEMGYRFHAPRRGDIAVFRPPIASRDDFIKRVIAVPGDTLRIQGGTVYVDDKVLSEPYLAAKTDYDMSIRDYGIYVDGDPLDPQQADVPPRSMWQAANRVPRGFYVMLGDNRNESDDSHVWGFAQLRGPFAAGPLARSKATAAFLGRAFLLFWPLRRLRILG